MKELKLRPCLANGQKALFHKWIESKYFVKTSPLIRENSENQICNNSALIEYPDGAVSVCNHVDIVFLDDIFFRV